MQYTLFHYRKYKNNKEIPLLKLKTTVFILILISISTLGFAKTVKLPDDTNLPNSIKEFKDFQSLTYKSLQTPKGKIKYKKLISEKEFKEEILLVRYAHSKCLRC